MNYSPINLTKVGLFLTAVSSLFLIAKPSQAVIANLSTSPSPGINHFTQDGTTGAVNAVAGSNAIDNATDASGFDDFFGTNDFLLLGSKTTDSTIIGDTVRGGNSIADSRLFPLNSVDLSNGINIDFNWAFDGNANGNSSNKDNFSIVLYSEDESNQADVFSQKVDQGPPVSIGYGTGSEKIFLNGTNFESPATAGNYFLRLQLNENGTTSTTLPLSSTNYSTAAGFNNVSVSAVPFEFSPAQGLLAVGGLWGISAYLKRRKAAAMLNSNLAS
jgi:hypothetical protein